MDKLTSAHVSRDLRPDTVARQLYLTPAEDHDRYFRSLLSTLFVTIATNWFGNAKLKLSFVSKCFKKITVALYMQYIA